MKINIALPAALRQEADVAAKALGVSRSKLVRIALEAFLQERRDEAVTAALRLVAYLTISYLKLIAAYALSSPSEPASTNPG